MQYSLFLSQDTSVTMARGQLVDVSLARLYHCATRRVRRAFLLGEGDQHRKEWIENRLEEFSDIFAVAVDGFSVMKNGEISRETAEPQNQSRSKAKVFMRSTWTK
jgi:hypothetical protein